MAELRQIFGRRLRQIRRSQDLTQEQLAERVGLSVNFISLIENGDAAPSFDTIEKLAQALNVSATDFFQPPSNNPAS